MPTAVMLPMPAVPCPLDDAAQSEKAVQKYENEVVYYGCKSLRFTKSIKLLCEQHGIPIIEVSDINGEECCEMLSRLGLDLIALGGGWPQLLTKKIIIMPRLGIINTHPSLLPNYRGGDVHRWQVLDGVSRSGTTIHYVDEKFDTGHIISQMEINVLESDTPQNLAENAGRVAGPMMHDVLKKIAASDPERVGCKSQKNNGDKKSYYNKWDWCDREYMRIRWCQDASVLHRFILASTQESFSYNGPFFYMKGFEYILRESSVVCAGRESHEIKPGTIVCIRDSGVEVKCGGNNVLLRLSLIQESSVHTPHTKPSIQASKAISNAGLKVGDCLG